MLPEVGNSDEIEHPPGEIEKQTARLFLLLKQKLLPPRSLWGKQGVAQIITRLRCIQQNVIDPVGSMPDVVLQSRVANYESGLMENLLYEDRVMIEYHDKGMSVIPIDDLWIFSNLLEANKKKHKELLRKGKSLADSIRSTIKIHGPLAVEDIQKNRDIPIYWENVTAVELLMTAMWECGELAIHHRDGPTIYYDLVKRVLPKKMLKHLKPMREKQYQDYRFIRRLNAVGLLPTTGGGDVWAGAGRAEDRMKCGRRLKEAEAIYTVRVKDTVKPYMYLVKDLTVMLAAKELTGRDDIAREVSFLAPLDNLLWATKMITELFDFRYGWEAHLAPGRRIFGFYVLPILYGDRFVGRIDPFYRIGEKQLEIRGLFWEDGFDPEADKAFVLAFVNALADFMKYLGAEQVKFDKAARPIPKSINQGLKKGGIKVRR